MRGKNTSVTVEFDVVALDIEQIEHEQKMGLMVCFQHWNNQTIF